LEDASFRNYFEGQSKQLPSFYINIIKEDLGAWWQWFPKEAIEHNAYAYLHKKETSTILSVA
jgi:hypothetical protein